MPALIFIIVTTVVILFQIAMACGAPWGMLTWGGKFPGVLPARMRQAAVVSAALLAVFILIVAIRAGMLAPEWFALSRMLVWIVVAYGAAGMVMNAITPSRWERILWLPLTIVMFLTSLLVALAA